jgi:hypothetical protein
MLRKVFNDEYDNELFIQKGFVKKPFLSAEQLAHMASALADLRPDDNFDPANNPTNPYNFSTYHCTFLDKNVEYKKSVDHLIRSVFAKGINLYLNDYEILTSNFYVKPPGTGVFQIHQNWPTLKDLNSTSVTIWVPLHDTSAENGTIHVVEGSHKMVPDIAAVGVQPFFATLEEDLIEKYLQPVNMKAGECLIFCDSLIHWSPQNNSDQPRIAVQIEAIPAEEQAVLYHYNPDKPDQFEMFEVTSDFFIENSIDAVISRPSQLRSLGFVSNRNKPLNEAEFSRKLGDAYEFRKSMASGKGKIDAAKQGFLNKLRALFRRSAV